MILDDERRAFLVSPVMIIVAGCGADLRPSTARALGARLGEGDVVELVASRWQWPTLVEDVARRGGVAVTFVRPNDYATYQAKGRGRVRAAGPDDLARWSATSPPSRRRSPRSAFPRRSWPPGWCPGISS